MTRTVLVAEDNPTVLMLVRASLASGDYELIEAHNGDDAWELLQQRRPPVAVLDVMMPGLNGHELIRMIRSDDRVRGTRIVVVTARAQDADRQLALDLGADAYLTKPFSPLELRQTVEAALSSGHRAR